MVVISALIHAVGCSSLCLQGGKGGMEGVLYFFFFMSLFYLVLRGGSKVSGREEHCCYMCPKVDFLQSEYFPDG